MNEYLAYSIFIAGGILALSRLVGDNLSKNVKDELSLYLMGEYQKSWPELFCQRFDGIFGEKHFSWRCFLISCLWSMCFVFAIYFLLGPVLGLLEQRTGFRYSIAYILLMGMLVNFIPDYLSLFETRWLLNRFKQTRSSMGIALLLLADVIISTMIILPGIWLYYYFTDSDYSLGHTFAAFSVTAVFFYSTFLTSIWVWLFGLSIFFLKLFRNTPLHNLLDVEEKANRSIGIVVAIMVLIIGGLSAVFTYPTSTNQQSSVSTFDRLICDWFVETCDNVAELTQYELEKMEFIIKGCAYKSNERCKALSVEQYNNEAYISAAKLFESRCTAGDSAGCTNLGILYKNGLGVEQDYTEAHRLYQQGCDGGIAQGCTNLGILYHDGLGVEQDYTEAHRLYQQGCDGGAATGCINFGLLYEDGQGVEQDYTEAHRLYQQGCDGGSAPGCTYLGMLYQNGLGVEQDYTEAHRLLQQGCDGEIAQGCTNLGILYQNGLGVEQDYTEAHRLYQQGCDGEIASGCTNLGILYHDGLGVEQDYTEAHRLYQQGCDGGIAQACTNLGILYKNGLGVEQDYTEAQRLYQQGCDGGSAPGCTNLGLLYSKGLGVEQDYTEAYRLYQQGCDGGNAQGCTNLGILYQNGLGVEQDYTEAHRL